MPSKPSTPQPTTDRQIERILLRLEDLEAVERERRSFRVSSRSTYEDMIRELESFREKVVVPLWERLHAPSQVGPD